MNGRIVLVANEKSTRAAQFLPVIRERLINQGHYDELSIESDVPLQQAAAEMANQFRAGDRILVAGGDGTIAAVVNAVACSKRRVSVGLLGIGLANDSPRAFNGRKALRDPIAVLSAKPVKTRPLKVTITHANGDLETVYALSNVVMGWAAVGASYFGERTGKRNYLQAIRQTTRLLSDIAKNPNMAMPRYFRNAEEHPCSAQSIVCATSGPVAVVFRPRHKRSVRTIANRRFSETEFIINMHTFKARGREVFRTVSRVLFGAASEVQKSLKLSFPEPADIPIALDGEICKFSEVSSVVIDKLAEPLTVLSPKFGHQSPRRPGSRHTNAMFEQSSVQ